MNVEEIQKFLADLKIESHCITKGSENDIPMIFVGIPESRRTTITKLLKLGFKKRNRYFDEFKGNVWHKEFSIKIQQ